jgi:hypothetical protein
MFLSACQPLAVYEIDEMYKYCAVCAGDLTPLRFTLCHRLTGELWEPISKQCGQNVPLLTVQPWVSLESAHMLDTIGQL